MAKLTEFERGFRIGIANTFRWLMTQGDDELAQQLLEESDLSPAAMKAAGVSREQLTLMQRAWDNYRHRRLTYFKSPGSVQTDLSIRRDPWTPAEGPIARWRKYDTDPIEGAEPCHPAISRSL